jgi:predicted nucleic acid-binding protein
LTQPAVNREIIAIMTAVRICKAAGFPIFGSIALANEIGKISHNEKLKRVRSFYNYAVSENIALTTDIDNRAEELTAWGVKPLDSYHVAFAEVAGADYLLTTDARFERICARLNLTAMVINPFTFIGEYAKWLPSI